MGFLHQSGDFPVHGGKSRVRLSEMEFRATERNVAVCYSLLQFLATVTFVKWPVEGGIRDGSFMLNTPTHSQHHFCQGKSYKQRNRQQSRVL